MIKCDLHGFRFKDAKFEIIKTLRRCFNMGEKILQIIHGYHGHDLKDYIEKDEFLKDMKEEGFYLKNITPSTEQRKNPGESIFKLNLKKPYNQQKRIKLHIKPRDITKILKGGKKINIIDLQALFL